MDSHAARALVGPGYEVFVLMEYCSGHGLIDFMNTRLREMLSEAEILQIACDIGLGISNMHYLSPPLIHRDLKIENVLISGDGVYKLCDFGSVSVILRPPRNATEFQILDNDIQSHTTAQYRSPEMIDLSRGFPIDEKSDIWAFGVFIYKLCYYTTPFEREGNLAILNASFTFPPKPVYSDRLKRVINVCLSEDPRLRPNIFQCLKELYRMRGMEVPIKDIYTAPTSTTWKTQTPHEKRRESLPIEEPVSADSSNVEVMPTASSRGAVYAPPAASKVSNPIPNVKPMYRGRPQPPAPKKSALDTKFKIEGEGFPKAESQVREDTQDDIESKYPTIEALTESLEKQSFKFSATKPQQSYSSTSALMSYSQAPHSNNSKSLPSSVTHTPAPSDGEFNLRPSALVGTTWSSASQKQSDPWTPSPRPVMVNHSTSPITSRSTTPALKKKSKSRTPRAYDLSSSDDDHEPVAPARDIPPRPLSSSSKARKSEESSHPTIHFQAEPLPPVPKSRNSFGDGNLTDSVNVSDEHEKLKVFLTGLSEKSTTVMLDEEEPGTDARFLKPIDKEGTGRSWRSRHNRSPSGNSHSHLTLHDVHDRIERPRSRSAHKKTASTSFKSKIDGAFKKFDPMNARGPKRSSFENRRSYKQDDDDDSDSPDDYDSRPSDAVAIVRETSFMESEDPSQFQRPVNSKLSVEVQPAITGKKKPSSSIQKRIQAYINRSPSPPPRRTAMGYGQYTDFPESNSEFNESSGNVEKKLPPKPPAKPKHLMSPQRSRSEVDVTRN